MEFDRCSLVRKGVGESLAGAATCLGSAEPMVSCCDGGPCGPENDVEVGDFGAPKAVINERTMHRVSMHWANVSLPRGSLPLERPILTLQRALRLAATTKESEWLCRYSSQTVSHKADHGSLGAFSGFPLKPELNDGCCTSCAKVNTMSG